MTARDPRRLPSAVMTLVVVTLVLGACGDDPAAPDPVRPTPAAPGNPGSGPSFQLCGAVSTADVAGVMHVDGLVNTVRNTSVCEWVTAAGHLGPQISFNWYRGSPIGREHITELLQRDSLSDITVDGANGFLASSAGICEIGIGFGADFIEWSAGSGAAATGAGSTDRLCSAVQQLATITVERSKG